MQLSLNIRFQKLKSTSLTQQYSKLVINFALNFIRNQLTDKQSYLHSKSEHPRSMKNSITHRQALRLNKTETVSHINKAFTIPRNEILNKNPIENDEKIPLILTFHRTLPDLRHS